MLITLLDVRLTTLIEYDSITSGVSPKSITNLMSFNTALASANSISLEKDLLHIKTAINSPPKFYITILSPIKASASLVTASEFKLNLLF